MAQTDGKENIADGLVANGSFKAPSQSPKKSALSPTKSSRKTRSKSIGPGGLGEADAPALKESTGNRRKSAFIPAVKSILASNDEDEKKRREARRKSLARRRVSFAPEATLHTWDVVEYMRDATTSSASSEATRRASSVSQASTRASPAPASDPAEPPSTPPEQAEEPQPEPGSSPANQRAQHQKKNRRSSGIPPMNFNNPDDVCSSSPLSGDNASPGGDSEDSDDAAENLPASPHTDDSSQSSARLDAALREATTLAGTQKLDFDDDDDDGDMTMDMAQDEITASFKPWAAKKRFVAQYDQENASLFSPARPVADGDEDMSMDITRAVGRIVPQQQPDAPSSDMDDDMSMELTMPLGSIQAVASNAQANRRKSLKRRVSLLDASQGSPAKRPASRRTSLRQRQQSEEQAPEDATMDLTMAIGAIKKAAPSEPARRPSIETTFDEATMDFTLAVGTIKKGAPTTQEHQEDDTEDEDLSMEFTKIVGPGIRRAEKPATTPEKPAAATPLSASKTATPQKSPAKSLARRMSSLAKPEPGVAPETLKQTTPSTSGEVVYPNLDPGTPEIVRQKDIEEVEPSPFVRRNPKNASEENEALTTPTNQQQPKAPMMIPEDPIAAPILNRRRSSLSAVQFSPLNAPREEPALKSTALLTNSIKLLSTPRKQTLMSPVKRSMTPKKSQSPQKQPTPKQKTPTPKKATLRKSMSPKKRVIFGEQQEDEIEVDDGVAEDPSEVERISLQDFLDMTKIRFMDLSTTKRRHTAAPAAFHDVEVEEKEESLDRYVVAGACTLPEYELYQHACHEMKKYISDGRHFVRTMEANVLEDNPLLFSEYLTAPPDQRAVMDTQFKNLKTNARLEARGEWYTWRSMLLQDLKSGLVHTLDGFKRDESTLINQEQLLDVVLPPLIEKQMHLLTECKQRQQRHDELNSCDREELEQTREKLIATDAEMEEKKRLLLQLQQELAHKEARIEAVKERKIECSAEIKAAERMREECRGWSTSEVSALRAKVTALEQAHGWSITSASSTSITMTHMNDLELYFQPSAFSTGSNTPNESISLAYIGDSATPHPRPLTTSKRFFLQLIRAHLHGIPQSRARISSLLALVKNGWATALAVAEGVRWLEHHSITEEFILSDERMAISTNMLLPTLQTKIKATFEVGVDLGKESVETEVSAKAEVVYGEKYGEEKMGAFLRDFCGNQVKGVQDMAVWADAMLDLAARLRKTGRKGERK
ncbi:Spc7-domain-containing protein [Decorospora gaudefroyi]|uniref:Spc7-domain-containing protein n=1 Tax=Decorospora gaudefroyi TaxID=184978 RepID=A0A6A5KA01_9PLEO|nr:Spc7-domain-containing protein [Decorospora gaudefroyi]